MIKSFTRASLVAMSALFVTTVLLAQEPAAPPIPAKKIGVMSGGTAASRAATRPTSRAAAAKKPDIYDPKADAKAQIAAAIAKAKRNNTRVLITYGGNWCGWCHKLHDLFAKDREISHTLLYEYERVMVSIGDDPKDKNKNKDIAASYGTELKGYPFLVVLDGDGKVLVNQETDSLELVPHTDHDPAKVKAFLAKYVAPQQDAEVVYAAALAKAKAEDKKVLVRFDAPWCGWCHRLDDFLTRADIAPLMAVDYVDTMIDEDRMVHGKELEARVRKEMKGGIPWFAMVSPDGTILATSDEMVDGKPSNIGYPGEPNEIVHFMGMLKTTLKRTTPDQLATLEAALVANAPKPVSRPAAGTPGVPATPTH